MGKHRRRSWIPHGHEVLLEDHFAHLREKEMSNGSAMNGISNGYLEPEDEKPASAFAKIFQASTYFPISQQSPSLNHANGTTPLVTTKESPIKKNKQQTSNKSLLLHALESFSVGFYVFGFVFSPLVLTIISFTVLFFPPLWIFAIPYFCWFIYDRSTPCKGSRPMKFFRSLFVWKYMKRYFPMRIVKTAELPADRNYIVAAHPHGILSFGTFLTFCTEAPGFSELFPGLQRRYAVTLPIQYWFPIRRELLMLTNTISSEASAIEHVLEERECGTVVGIVPGGADEALNSFPDNYKLTLKNRKGFIKLSLKYGASLVPMYTFGETSTYKQIPNPEGSRIRRFQSSLKHILGVTLPFFYGHGLVNSFFGFMPFRVPLNTVIGKPISVQKVEDPSYKQISDLHKKYCQALSDLFDEHKCKYGVPKTAKLEFV
ncbi:Diacylglycerol acyltransferase family-containing protein [Aphelenchoides bicaudatus]|nr:Diacylglycerol acyltransferase family-containing protein [Aphelenchoides bicaudatus]